MKVLILCNDFPPLNSIGAQRPYSWFKFFKQNGIEPIVVTKRWQGGNTKHEDIMKPSSDKKILIEEFEEGTVIRVPIVNTPHERIILKHGLNKNKFLRKAFAFSYKILQFPFFRFDKHAGIYFAARDYLKKNKVDFIIATGEPFVLFRYGNLLSKEFNIKWSADYRDSWKLNHVNFYLNDPLSKFFKWWEWKFEKRFVSTASFISSTEPLLAKTNANLHGKKAKIIYNGFDEFFQASENQQPNSKLLLSHTGTLTIGQRIEFLLKAIKELDEEKKISPDDLELRFIGLEYYPEMLQRVMNYDERVKKYLSSTLRVSRNEALQMNSESDYLIALSEKHFKTIFAKTYDYLSVKKSILVIPDDESILSNLVADLDAGTSFKEIETLKKFLLEKISLKKKGELDTRVNIDESKTKFYTREQQAKIFTDELKNFIVKKPKALILCHDFPPYNSVGAQRPYSWYLYFKKYGLTPVILSRHWNSDIKQQLDFYKPSTERKITWEENATGEIVRVPYAPHGRDRFVLKYGYEKFSFIRKILTVFYYNLRFELGYLDSTLPIYKQGVKMMKQEKYDVIIASGEPFILFKHAAKLSKKFNTPWIADYRDGWSTNHALGTKLLANKFLLNWEASHEKKYVSRAKFFDSVSKPIVDEISSLVKIPGYIIPNGAEIFHYVNPPTVEQEKVFTVAYTGLIYESSYGEILIEGLKKFFEINSDGKFQFKFVGTETQQNFTQQKLVAFAKNYSNKIIFQNRVSPEEAALIQRKAHVLLSLIPGSQSKGIMAAKTYSYAASKNPIIVIPSEPDRGTTFFPNRDIQIFCLAADEFCETLNQFYQQYLRGEKFQTSITEEEIFSISREAQAKKLAELALQIQHPTSNIQH